jgi:hypothetical protein
MMVLRLALMTAVFYLGMAVLLEATIIIISRIREGGFGLYGTRWGWTLLFGLLWLASFSLAWRVLSIGASGPPTRGS